MDFISVFKGYWKRNMTWRLFGGDFRVLKSSNNIVYVEHVSNANDSNEDSKQSNVTYLNWKFGDSLDPEKLNFGYLMKVEDDLLSEESRISKLEWQYRGQLCTGTYQYSTRVAVFEFKLESSTVIITYRVVDKDTLAVCIVEVDSTQNSSGKPHSSPTIQYGHMFRINPEDYANSNSSHNAIGNLYSSSASTNDKFSSFDKKI